MRVKLEENSVNCRQIPNSKYSEGSFFSKIYKVKKRKNYAFKSEGSLGKHSVLHTVTPSRGHLPEHPQGRGARASMRWQDCIQNDS